MKNQPTNQLTIQPDQPTNQPTITQHTITQHTIIFNQPNIQPIDQPTNQPTHQPSNPTDQPINLINQSISFRPCAATANSCAPSQGTPSTFTGRTSEWTQSSQFQIYLIIEEISHLNQNNIHANIIKYFYWENKWLLHFYST